MGFATVFTSLNTAMISNATGFIGDFQPILAGVVGISFAGFALLIIRRFVG